MACRRCPHRGGHSSPLANPRAQRRGIRVVLALSDPGGIKFPEGPTIPGRTGVDAASIPISCVGTEIRLTKKRPAGQRAESMALCEDGQFIPRGAVYVHNQ